MQQGIPRLGCLSVDSNDLASMWINEPGFFALTMASKLPAAKKYQRWVFSEVLPSIHKTGKYAINSEHALIDAFDASRIATGNSKNNMQVLYYGDIGVHDGEHLLKFGCSDNIRKRVLQGHKKAFQQFTLQRAFSAMNNREVESRFKEDVDIQKQRVSRTINGKKQTELLVLNNNFTTKDLDTIIHRIIAKNPPGLMDNLKRHLDTEDKEVKLARLETDAKFNMRRLELESHTRLWRRPQAEKDMKRMEMKHELDMTKLKYKMRLSSKRGRTFASSPDKNMSDDESSADEEPIATPSYADMVAEHLPAMLVFEPDVVEDLSLLHDKVQQLTGATRDECKDLVADWAKTNNLPITKHVKRVVRGKQHQKVFICHCMLKETPLNVF